MNVNMMFPSHYVRGDELPKEGLKITIAAVRPEKMRGPGGESDGWVLWVAGAKRGIVLTGALARQIAQVLNEQDADNWPGRQVMIFPEPMVVAGVPRVAIRARGV